MTSTPLLMIGLGSMGGAIAGRLAATGWRVLGTDVVSTAVEAARSRGVVPAGSVESALGEAEFVLTSLPDPAAVRAVYLKADGVAARLRPGQTVIELSTIDPSTMREVATACERAGARVLDVPVSGGIEEAARGELSLMVGGDSGVIDIARSVLDSIGTILPAGGIGDAKVIKLVNNLVAIANVLAGVEALHLARAAGVDAQRFYDVLSASGARSYQFNKRIPRAMVGDFDARFSLGLAAKDLRLVNDMADEISEHLPGARAVAERFRAALEAGLGDQDMLAVLKLYDHTAPDSGHSVSKPAEDTSVKNEPPVLS